MSKIYSFKKTQRKKYRIQPRIRAWEIRRQKRFELKQLSKPVAKLLKIYQFLFIRGRLTFSGIGHRLFNLQEKLRTKPQSA